MQTQTHLTTNFNHLAYPTATKAKPIFGIARIDRPTLAHFYMKAWGIYPAVGWFYGLEKTKKARRKIITHYGDYFRSRAKSAGIVIGHGAGIKDLLICYVSFSAKILSWYSLGDEIYELYRLPSEYHFALAPFVQVRIKRYERDHDWRLILKQISESEK